MTATATIKTTKITALVTSKVTKITRPMCRCDLHTSSERNTCLGRRREREREREREACQMQSAMTMFPSRQGSHPKEDHSGYQRLKGSLGIFLIARLTAATLKNVRKLKVTVAVRVRFSKNGPLRPEQTKGTGEIGHDRICFDKRTGTGCIVRREYRKVLVSCLLTYKKGWEKRTGHSRRLISESSRRARSPWKRSHAPPSVMSSDDVLGWKPTTQIRVVGSARQPLPVVPPGSWCPEASTAGLEK
ncbi:hypothetical protein RUM43_002409 [Polyplax serrata]|uniref:Uncharacterized protein n=1 Tax=Polyplax serrata TaxID=468196 RepID=A0AAN8NYS7_POLSC